jgi:hypothetical protein
MKRDMEVVRQILLFVESNQARPDQQIRSVQVDEVSDDTVTYHVRLLMEAGYLNGAPHVPPGRGAGPYWITGIAWQGHEMLDAVRDPEVWKQTKGALQKIGGTTVGFMIDIAKAYGKHVIKERLGIDV